LDNLSDFFHKGLNPFQIQGRFKFEIVPEFVPSNPKGFVVGPKSKVVPFVSDYRPAKFSEFWASRR
jgi:hypothetical protein